MSNELLKSEIARYKKLTADASAGGFNKTSIRYNENHVGESGQLYTFPTSHTDGEQRPMTIPEDNKKPEILKGLNPEDAYKRIAAGLKRIKIGNFVTATREFTDKEGNKSQYEYRIYKGIPHVDGARTKIVHKLQLQDEKRPLRKRWREVTSFIYNMGPYLTDPEYRREHSNKPLEDITEIITSHTEEEHRLRFYAGGGSVEKRAMVARRWAAERHSGSEFDLVIIAYDGQQKPVMTASGCQMDNLTHPFTVEPCVDVKPGIRGDKSQTLLLDLGGIYAEYLGTQHMHVEIMTDNKPINRVLGNHLTEAVRRKEVPWSSIKASRGEDYTQLVYDIDFVNSAPEKMQTH